MLMVDLKNGGKRDINSMEKEYQEPPGLTVHELINKMSIILGYCDLLLEEAKVGSRAAKRLYLIRNVAQNLVEGLREKYLHEGKKPEVA